MVDMAVVAVVVGVSWHSFGDVEDFIRKNLLMLDSIEVEDGCLSLSLKLWVSVQEIDFMGFVALRKECTSRPICVE